MSQQFCSVQRLDGSMQIGTDDLKNLSHDIPHQRFTFTIQTFTPVDDGRKSHTAGSRFLQMTRIISLQLNFE